jgi:membrane protein required for colicin V production
LFFFKEVVVFIEKYIPQLHHIIPFIAFALVFFAIIKLVNYIGNLLKTALSFTPFGIVDSLLGALIGLIKIILILAAFLMLLEWLKYEQMIKWMSVSKLYPYIKGVANGLFNSWL